MAALLLMTVGGCIQSPVPTPGGTAGEQLARLELLYADARELYFQIYVTSARGAMQNLRGQSLADMRGAHFALRTRAFDALGALDSSRYGAEDRRAIRTMRAQLQASTSIEQADAPAPADEGGAVPSCSYRASALAVGDSALARLAERIYSCYGKAASHVVTHTDTSDRLSVLARLGTEPSSAEREKLWRSLASVWASVNGDNAPDSPYRTMLPLVVAAQRLHGSSIARAATSLGMPPAQVESTLLRVLQAWRDHTPAAPVEPWNWYYENGALSRRFSPRLNVEAMQGLNDRFYGDQGADLSVLNIQYDLAPRPGKTPVAFTQFGKAARLRRGDYGESEAWVFATYRSGGFDNLTELLHETGHAIHISAIATRPAFADWPDSDPFTEALGDLLALETYEPAWQERYLGSAAPLDESQRAKYGAIVMDVAWALFELRMLRDPSSDPNAEWTAITREYLHIVPHPELSWWAQRGQLVESPGYMMNYALGAMVTAELRQKVREARGTFSQPNEGMYRWLSDRLYQWGLERPSREVLQGFLGNSLGAEALIADLGRIPAH
ncbi:MAG: hypothetical protein ABIZ91_02120 [Gemmatimonadaceae bacterium]